jgi:hypothetical protein
MRKGLAAGLSALVAGFVVSFSSPSSIVARQPDTDAKAAPKFLYGHDLRVRPGGKKDFTPETPRIGVEVFHDEATKAIIGISENGSLAVAPAVPVGAERTCKWLTAHDLAARKAGELEFTQGTKKFGVELFRDMGSNRLLYACETASIAFAPIRGELVTDRGPKWHHALEPKVRNPDMDNFEGARKFGMEIFKDENTGGLIYIVAETGSIATAPAPATAPDPKKLSPPATRYGLVLRVRGAGEPDFTDKTKKVGVEVFEDPNANVFFYLTQFGHVATAPNPGKVPPEARGVTWKGAIALKARKGGDKTFDSAKKYGIEVFQDNRTGNLIFICETGSIAVLPKQ